MSRPYWDCWASNPLSCSSLALAPVPGTLRNEAHTLRIVFEQCLRCESSWEQGVPMARMMCLVTFLYISYMGLLNAAIYTACAVYVAPFTLPLSQTPVLNGKTAWLARKSSERNRLPTVSATTPKTFTGMG